MSYLTISPLGSTEIELTPDAHAASKAALALAHEVTTVSDAFDAGLAADALSELQTLERSVEAARKEVKAPVLELQRRIDGLAKEFICDVATESLRIGRLLGEYQANERRKQQEAEREARKREQYRLAQLEAERQERIEQETKGRTEALTPDLERLEEEAAREIVAIRQEAATVASKAPAGTSTRGTLRFEVEDSAALLKARPDLFTPDERKIRAALTITPTLPGVRAWKEYKASTKR